MLGLAAQLKSFAKLTFLVPGVLSQLCRRSVSLHASLIKLKRVTVMIFFLLQINGVVSFKYIHIYMANTRKVGLASLPRQPFPSLSFS